MGKIDVVIGKPFKEGVNVNVGNKSGDKNIIEEVQVNGSALPVVDKAVNVPVPTNVSQLENDAGYLTEHQDLSSYALKSEIPTVPTKVSAFANDAGYLTEHQDLSDYYKKNQTDTLLAGKQDKLSSGTNIKTINGESILGSGDIEIESGDEAVWGNISGTLANQTDLSEALAAKYQKPSGGIPKTDLASAVQTSLGKADTALQSFTETDPTVPSWAKAANKPSYSYSEITNKPSIPDQLSDLSDDSTHRLVTDAEKTSWSAKYSKPSGGIPANDLASGVIPDVSGFITKSVNNLDNYYTKSVTYTKAEVDAALLAYWPKEDAVDIDLADVAITGDWGDIENNPIPEPASSDNGKVLGVTDSAGTLGWVEQSGGGSGGGVSSVGVSVPTGFDVSGSPITSSGTIAITFDDGYSLPTDTKQGEWDDKYEKPSTGIPETDLASAVQTSLGLADTAYQKPSGGIPASDLASAVQTSLGKADTALQSFTETDPTVPSWAKASTKPSYSYSEITGTPTIPDELADLSDDTTHRVVTDTEKATWNAKYNKPSGGIPKTDLASAVQTSLGKADSALQSESDPVFSASAAAGISSSDITSWNGKYTKPASGIPASDLADGVIPTQVELTTAIINSLWDNA